MKIFIDESGSFTKSTSSDVSISCVGTLVIPDWNYERLLEKYKRLRNGLPKNSSGEVKGRLLNERQVAKVIDLLIRNNTMFEAILIDMNVQDEVILNEQLQTLKENHTKGLSPLALEKNAEWLEKVLSAFNSMNQQLLVQFLLTTKILHRTIQHATMYFSLRVPRELGSIEWYIDAKSREGVTRAETWWWETVAPFLSSMSKSQPVGVIPCGDYSFYNAAYSSIPEEGEGAGADLRKVFSNLIFKSEIDYGLELVDIVTNTLRRALAGNLQEEGWCCLPDLVIRTSEEGFHFIVFSHEKDFTKLNVPYAKTYKKIAYGRKKILTPKSDDWIAGELEKESCCGIYGANV